MYILLEELMNCIYNDQVYQDYLKSKLELEDNYIKELLLEYQDKKNNYYHMKKYEKYTDISSVKKEFVQIKNKISKNNIIQDYYHHYYLLNDMLEELTKIIFDGISDDLTFDRYSL